MHNKDNLLKESKSLLLTAQKEVTRELNSQKSFIAKLFAGDASESLKTAQSNIAKALNNLEALGAGDTQTVSKLQSNMNEKDNKIKALESELKKSFDDQDSLKGKIKFLEAQQQKQEQALVEINNKVKETETVVPVAENQNQGLLAKLEEEKTKLEQERSEINEKYQGAKKELKEVQNLAIEYSKRMSKLKSEILAA